MELQSLNIQASDVGFLPIVSSFVKKMGVVEGINRLCPGETDVSAGRVVRALIIDTLSERSPLYRLECSFKAMDMGLLLGVGVPPSKLNDDTVGRVLDPVWETHMGKLLPVEQKTSVPFKGDYTHLFVLRRSVIRSWHNHLLKGRMVV